MPKKGRKKERKAHERTQRELFVGRVLCFGRVLWAEILCRGVYLEGTPSFLRQKCANMPTLTQQVVRHSFRFPGPFAH